MGNAAEPIRFLPRDGAHAPHPVMLSGLRGSGDSLQIAPAIVERRDQDFVDGVLNDLRDDKARQELLKRAPKAQKARGYSKDLPRLYAPVQRVFNVVLLEAFCNQPGLIPQPGNASQPLRPGLPRLDPQSIESCGMVLRRVLATRVNGARYEAWLKSGTTCYGWDAIAPDHEDDDPAADRRAPAVSVGNTNVNASLKSNLGIRSALSTRLAGQSTPVHENVSPVFVAPPDIAEATHKTVLFGVVQVASSDQSEGPAATPGYGKDAQERRQLRDPAHLNNYLAEGGPRTFPRAGERFDSAWALRVGKADPSSQDFRRNEDLKEFTKAVQQLGVEFDAFNPKSEAGQALLNQLNALKVEYDSVDSKGKTITTTGKAGDFFQQAYHVILTADTGASFTMPHRISKITAAQADAVFDAVLAALDAQYKALKPGKGRFEADSRDVEARYVLRAFIRLKSEHPGCPGRIVWSPYSEQFTIAPWYESAGQPSTMVELPDLFDRDALKAIKPNVAFAVPPKLAKLLTGDPKELRDGTGNEGDGLGLAWICSFSIPIITICAFIVLSIFLTLFNLIFWWLPFLKICIPFPKKLP